MLDFLANLKSERKLSYKHWRYRLLHWVFDIDPKDRSQRCKVAPFLYSHYCPLFHFTNILLLASPLILILKILVALAWIVAGCIENLIGLFVRSKDICLEERVWTDEEKATWLVATEKKLTQQIIVRAHWYREEPLEFEKFNEFYLAYLTNNRNNRNINVPWEETLHELVVLDTASLKVIWDAYYSRLVQLVADQKLENAKKALRNQRIAFWVNFSRIFIKGAINIVYFLAATGLGFVFVVWGIPALWTATAGLTELLVLIYSNLSNILWHGLAITSLIVVSIGVLTFLYAVSDSFKKLSYVIATPFGVVRDAFGDLLDYVTGICSVTRDFIMVFYEDNCPPIKIIESEEECSPSPVQD